MPESEHALHGVLPAVRVGRAFRVRGEDVDALLQRASAESGSLATRRDVWTPTTTSLPEATINGLPGPSGKDPTRSSPPTVAEPRVCCIRAYTTHRLVQLCAAMRSVSGASGRDALREAPGDG